MDFSENLSRAHHKHALVSGGAKHAGGFPKKTKIIEGIHNIPSDADAFVVATPWYLNDKIENFFKFEKKPILFEKPLGAFNSNHKFIRSC